MPVAFDLDAEDAVLGSMLSDPRCVPSVLRVIPKDAAGWFAVAENRPIFTAIVEFYEAGNTACDVITFSNHLRNTGRYDACGGIERLTDLVDSVPSSVHAEYYAGIIAEAHRRRLFSTAIRDAESEISGTDSTAEVVSRLVPRVEAAAAAGRSTSTECHSVGLEIQNRIAAGASPTFLTGYDIYDTKAHLRPSRYAVVAARPSHGKTTFLLNVARHLAMDTDHGCGVLFITLEMTVEDLYMMVASQIQNISRGLLERAQIPPEDQLRHVHTAAMRIPQDRLFFAQCWSDAEVIAEAAVHKQRFGIGCVMVDYLQLLRPIVPGKMQTEYEQISRVSMELARASKRLNLAFVVAAQLNRAIESRGDGVPQMSDLRGSGQIEQDATSVLFLQRPHLIKSSEPPNLLKVFLKKNRHGPVCEQELWLDASTGRIEQRNQPAEPPVPERDSGEPTWPDPY